MNTTTDTQALSVEDLTGAEVDLHSALALLQVLRAMLPAVDGGDDELLDAAARLAIFGRLCEEKLVAAIGIIARVV